MKVVSIVQARMGSRRLPGKVLESIDGRPMIAHVMERAARADRSDAEILATSTAPEDDALQSWAEEHDILYHRGSEPDVLDRFYRTAEAFDAEAIIRLTGDCPLLDPEIIDRVTQRFLGSDADYVSNTLDPTYPDGLDVEVFGFEPLEIAWEEAELPRQREHVTPFLRDHPGRFAIVNVEHDVDLSGHRWTVDESEDLQFVRELSKRAGGLPVGLERTLDILRQHPELAEVNAGIERNEGYQRSLDEDHPTTDR